MDDLLQEMIDPTPEPGDRPRRRRLVATIAIVGLAVVGVTSLTTGALFTDREQTDDGFTTGTVDLTIGDLNYEIDPAVGFAPGDVRGSAVQVQNTGSLQLRYAAEYTATSTAGASVDNGTNEAQIPADSGFAGDAGTADATAGDVRTVMHLAVYDGVDASTCNNVRAGNPNPGGTRIYPTDSAITDIWDAPRLSADGAPFAVIGNKATGPQGGEITLGAGQSNTLCFVLGMDLDANNAFQNAGLRLNLDFFAEQTANNPDAAPNAG